MPFSNLLLHKFVGGNHANHVHIFLSINNCMFSYHDLCFHVSKKVCLLPVFFCDHETYLYLSMTNKTYLWLWQHICIFLLLWQHTCIFLWLWQHTCIFWWLWQHTFIFRWLWEHTCIFLWQWQHTSPLVLCQYTGTLCWPRPPGLCSPWFSQTHLCWCNQKMLWHWELQTTTVVKVEKYLANCYICLLMWNK